MANLTYFKKFDTKSDYDAYIGGDPILPNVSIVANEDVYFTDGEGPEPPHDYSKDYLTFNIVSGGDISWGCVEENGATIEYKKNNGEWTEITATPLDPETMSGGTKISVVAGDKVKFRGDNAAYSLQGEMSIGTFAAPTAGFTIEGNIMSLIDSVNYKEITGMTNDNVGAFAFLFSMCTGLTSAENLILPATTLVHACYSLMFGYCTSLTAAPELPATTLASNCYENMFFGCTSLTTAPELPATTLAYYCYASMFEGCSSLTTAPELPASTLTDWCYYHMFSGCTSLNYIKCLATDISAVACTDNWVNGVFSTGTFVKNANMSSWIIGAIGNSGIPEEWTVQDA